LTWAHPEADLELRAAGPGEELGSPTELWPQFGLLGWASAPQPVDGVYQIEVRRGTEHPALVYEAELVVARGEGTKDERWWRVPIKLRADQPIARFVLRGDKVEAQ